MQQSISSKVLEFINDFKKQYPDAMEDTFLHGYCYWFAKILSERFNGIICYEPVENHFITLIESHFYDISGEVTPTEKTQPWEVYKWWDELETNRIIRDCIRKERRKE